MTTVLAGWLVQNSITAHSSQDVTLFSLERSEYFLSKLEIPFPKQKGLLGNHPLDQGEIIEARGRSWLLGNTKTRYLATKGCRYRVPSFSRRYGALRFTSGR
jgi:hypothetical protein